MLKYLIIPLAKNAVSFCHYDRGCGDALIGIDTLKSAIFWAMKENLNVQFLFPDNELPDEYKRVIDTIDHTSIVGSACKDMQLRDDAEVVVFDEWDTLKDFSFKSGKSYVVRTDKDGFFKNAQLLNDVLKSVDRIVVVITNPDNFSDEDFEKYKAILNTFIPTVVGEYKNNHAVHFNLLTDRMLLDKMNNCNAGDESITLAPDGKFYICPTFYIDGCDCVGDLENGLNIKNQQLYRLDHAPICRQCDAYQCRRCVWLNRKTTLEVNTPSHEQCVIAHIERNASKKLMEQIRQSGIFISNNEIPNIDYLDPFEIIKQ